MSRMLALVAGCLLTLMLAAPLALHAQEPPPSAEEVTPDPWPKISSSGGVTYTIYQPQLINWDDSLFTARAAVSVLPAGAKEPVFGVIEFTAKTHVFRLLRTVHFHDFTITTITFPSAPDLAGQYVLGFQKMVAEGPSTMSLDRLEAMLAIEGAEKRAQVVPVQNEPPQFIFSQTPALLVPVDGEPVWRPVAGTTLERVLNTRALIVMDETTGKFYLHLFDGFVTASTLAGPWTVAKGVPAALTKLAQQLGKQRVVDLMEGQPDGKTKKKPSLKKEPPQVFVATAPTELIVTKGPPDWLPIDGTMLLYAKNTTGNLFKDMNDQKSYVLVTGRWFRAADLGGPWQYVAGPQLPPDFARIPDDSPKENVKASVPGTPQAQEAVIAATIPQMATVDRAKATFAPQINGSPELKPIPDTPLMYVYNAAQPIIMVSATQWFAVQSGVWFTAPSAYGPWTVATAVPAAIYAIPASSPLHYVTYVKIYETTAQTVVIGYTPGYLGTVVTSDGVVVYGTGYVYPPYTSATVWYPPPVTYGYAASVVWTPWTGWAVGFGFGWAMGAAYACAPAPYWGVYGAYYGYHGYYGAAYGYHGSAAVWGPGGWAATSGNVYQHYGSTGAVTRTSGGYNAWTGNAWSNKVGASYNSTTGRISAGQQASVANVYTGNYASGQRGATYNPTTGVSARGGSATYGNAYSGTQGSAKWGQVTGPGGQSTSAAKVNNNAYASHDGNVYKDTGSGWQKYDNGSWNSVEKPQVPPSVQGQQAARAAGDSRAAGSSWGSSSWGGGFDKSAAGSGAGASKSFGGGGFGGGGWDRGGGGFGGGGWDRGGGGFGGGGRSWGGGGFGGFRGGGGFRR